jgi:hypothetical protein
LCVVFEARVINLCDRDIATRSDQKLWPFGIVTLVGRDQTSASPSSDSASTPKKTASENSSKNLRAVQRSDKKLWHFGTVTLV